MFGQTKCPQCGAVMYPGADGTHECVPARLEQFQVEQATAELADDALATTLAVWGADAAIGRHRAFADYLRERELS
jgi:hypothetical protein